MEVKGIKAPDVTIAERHSSDGKVMEKPTITVPISSPTFKESGDYPDLDLSGHKLAAKSEKTSESSSNQLRPAWLFGSKKEQSSPPHNSGSMRISQEEIELAKSILFSKHATEKSSGNIFAKIMSFFSNAPAKKDNEYRTKSEAENRHAARYEKHKHTLDKFFQEKHLPQKYLSDDDYSYAVVMIDKRASGEITQEEFEQERIEFEKSKAQRETKEIIPEDTETLTEEQQDELNATFAMLGETDACIVFATAEDTDNPEEKVEILTAFAKEDMVEKQGTITEAVLEVLPDTLDENSIHICADATATMSELLIREKEELLENELNILSEEEKAQIRKQLAIQWEGIKIQNELLVIKHIKETQASITKHYEQKIAKEQEKYELIIEEQRKTEKGKEKLELKLREEQNKLDNIKQKIQKLKKELISSAKFRNPISRRFQIDKINAAIHLKEAIEESIGMLKTDIITADIEISSDLSRRQNAVHNMQASCRSLMLFSTASLNNQ